ncbi:hypothetical protein [Tindallia californiensis]|uniref:PilX N-terminal n=1 Tax=Tindallia californiensis TaxID=159292 RepID=A0A1H3PSA7_9FIRM|nr:hypothetical protein [Tindallia californiensis]SDZ03850.1 hypothetical protein SAMN05192546_10758 [Tindallia californiensis]
MRKKPTHRNKDNNLRETGNAASRRGSATVMVIMMVMTLMLLGVFSMMASYSGLAIARRNAEWTEHHYQQESQASEKLFLTHQALHTAWEKVNHEKEENGEKDETNNWHMVFYQDAMKTLEEISLLETVSLEPSLKTRDTSSESAFFAGEILVLADKEGKTQDFLVEFKVIAQLQAPPEINITSWRSIPEIFEYDDGILFWDVEVD